MKKESYNLLVVDDDFISYLLIKEILSPYNVSLLYADCGSQAIKTCIGNDNISLIFMDIKMKGMNGFETASFIKNFRKNVPIIFQTAYAESFINDEFMLQVGNGYIEKPIKKVKLMSEISKFLNLEINDSNLANGGALTSLKKRFSFEDFLKKMNSLLSF